MNQLDARGVLVQAVRQAGWRAQKTGKTLAFRCPRHDDSHASAWLGDHQWGCAACGFTEHFDTLAEILRVERVGGAPDPKGVERRERRTDQGLLVEFT